MEESEDHVSRIHRRYSFSLLTPAHRYQSLTFSIGVVGLLVATTVYGYLQSDVGDEINFEYPLSGFDFFLGYRMDSIMT